MKDVNAFGLVFVHHRSCVRTEVMRGDDVQEKHAIRQGAFNSHFKR